MKQFFKDTLYLLAFLALVLVAMCAVDYIIYTMPLHFAIPLFSMVGLVIFSQLI